MLVNSAKEEDGKGVREKGDGGDYSEVYRTANELYDSMIKNHQYKNIGENNSFKTRDLVILYENIDLGTKPLDSSRELVNKRPNQYVETVVYNDENGSEDSDVYEIYSTEDLHDVFTINNERIDLLCGMPSFDNTLCHKFGNMHMKSSDLTNEYDKHFLFNDPFIKEQLQSLHAMSDSKQYKSTILPVSLLDYICCKRFEDNYNYYMDNVIKYVQHTIEQLKRISNGDYLTDKAKEKWREVKNVYDNKTNVSEKTLACTTQTLLPIEAKVNRPRNTWDGIVQSEMDVRCLRKILEKKIILEIPKILCGSYRLCTKLEKNIVISLNKHKKRIETEHKKKSRVDIVVKLQKPEPESIISNINSVIVLKSIPRSITNTESPVCNCVSIQLKEVDNYDEKSKIVEVDDNGNDMSVKEIVPENELKMIEQSEDVSLMSDKMNDSDVSFRDGLVVPFDELNCNMHQLDIQTSLFEENEDFRVQKKSPTRVRIKSPYENKSYIIEEKRRKRLLEIREEREKRKLAMRENSKITKHKYAKSAVMAQSSNSVTKLSITNKSFYNSIYGQTNATKTLRNNSKLQKQDIISDLKIQECDEDSINESNHEQEKNSQKYINRSYYLDEADTEVMYLKMKSNNTADESNEILSPSTSVLSNETGSNYHNDMHLMNLSTTDLSGTENTSLGPNILGVKFIENSNKNNTCQNMTSNTTFLVPSNTPKLNKNKKVTSSECKKRIGEIYNLLKSVAVSKTNLKKSPNDNESQYRRKEITNCEENTTMQRSDSETITKQQLMSLKHSSIGFEKASPVIVPPKMFLNNKMNTVATVVPKVIINSKYQDDKSDKNKTKREAKKDDIKNSGNPLQAISQLIHDIDNIQRTRHKSGSESKKHKINDNFKREDNHRQLSFKTGFRQEKNIKQNNVDNSRLSKPMLIPAKCLKSSRDDKPVIKKLADIIDEVKEMRGEAVRGPSKRYSRIDSLAQPKKAYVKAQHEDYQNRFNRNIIPKIQKPAMNLQSVQEKHLQPKYRTRQTTNTDILTMSLKPSHKTENSLAKTVKFTRPADNTSSSGESEMHLHSTEPNSYITNASDPFKKKLSAVKTYLKHNFGRESMAIVPDPQHLTQISRAPLIPTDIDLASMASSPLAEESSTLGNKLHDIINLKITKIPSQLQAVTESAIKSDEKKVVLLDQSTKCGTDSISSTSDYPNDIFKYRNLVTAVACISKEDNTHINQYQIKELSLDNELQQLENALYRQMSSGTFQKRLRIKNLPLTPKQSMQQVFVLQSGDERSLIVKKTVSQKFNFSTTHSKLNILPVMSNDAVNWKLPMQLATVGYVFPTYQSLRSKTKNNICNNKNFANKLPKSYNKTVECYKGSNEQPSIKESSYINYNSTNVAVQRLYPNELNKSLIKENVLEKDITYNKSEKKNSNTGNISTSTSLDILVELLNEIKNITTCQSTFVSSENDKDTHNDSKEIKVILNKDAHIHSIDHSERNSLSVTSLDNLRQVDFSNICILTSNGDDEVKLKSNGEENINNDLNHFRPLLRDKAVDVQISTKELIHRITDIPSRILPSTMNRSAGVLSSLIAVVNSPSETSSFFDCQAVPSKSSLNEIKTLLPKTETLLPLKSEFTYLQIKNTVDSNITTLIYEYGKHKNKTFTKKHINGSKVAILSEFDSALKFKRDVLVTLYLILVFTVFAALSFPEIIFYE